VRLDEAGFTDAQWKSFKQIRILACGTSWHSALVGKHMIESLARVPVEVDYASEFRYRDPVFLPDSLFIFITQSGETADTISAQRLVRDHSAAILTITNVVGSMTTRIADGILYTRAGPEIGVASTKAFTSQVIALALLTLKLGRLREMSVVKGRQIAQAMLALPEQIQSILDRAPEIEAIAEQFKNATNFLYLGRGYNFPVALEGALKLKEISYIHAEGYPAAEMKHGPIALIDENMPVVFVAPHDSVFDKIVSNIQEVKARGGRVIAITSQQEPVLEKLIDHEIRIPQTEDMLYPILSVIPLQLLAYYIAVKRGLNVDQPRNLAKSVTVE
jgi:glucosamine--fructose-6-phosphate aminotransferase (isomerizing)